MNSRSKFSLGLSWRVLGLALYYFAILVAVILLHARGGLETPPFIYQGF
jgi:hypothetical protein